MPEKTGTKVAAGFLNFFTAVALIFGLWCIILTSTIFNSHYYVLHFVNDEFVDVMYEMLEDEDILADTNIDYDEAFPRDFLKRYMSDIVEYAFTGKSYDEDYYKDYIEDTVVPLIEDERGYSCSKSEIKDMQQEFLDSIDDVFGEMDTDSFEQLNEYKTSINMFGIGSLVLALVFAVLNLAIHKVKSRAVKSIAKAMLVASVLGTVFAYGLKSLFDQAAEESMSDLDKSMRPVMESFLKSFLIEPIIVCAGLAVVSLIIMIIAGAAAKKAKKEYLEENPAPVMPVQPAFNQYAQPVQPYAPVQPVQPVTPAANPNAAYMPPQQTVQPVVAQPVVAPVAPVAAAPVEPVAPVQAAPVAEPAPAMVTDPIVDTSASLGLSWICCHGHKNEGGKFCTTCGEARNL